METTQQRSTRTKEQNRVFFELSLEMEFKADMREYLPVSHLMSTMMKQDRTWLEDNYPELVLVHMGSPYYQGE